MLVSLAVGAGGITIAPAPTAQSAAPPYQDPNQPVAARVDDLLSRMSLDEKLGQMT
jgi:beta-glucosidase